MAQSSGPERVVFTVEEFYQAFRVAMPDAQAREIADAMGGPPPELPREWLESRRRPRTGGRTEGIWIDETGLLLLALVSDTTYAKVEAYRRLHGNGGKPRSAEQERDWQAKLAEYRRWKAAGFPDRPVGPDPKPPADDE